MAVAVVGASLELLAKQAMPWPPSPNSHLHVAALSYNGHPLKASPTRTSQIIPTIKCQPPSTNHENPLTLAILHYQPLYRHPNRPW